MTTALQATWNSMPTPRIEERPARPAPPRLDASFDGVVDALDEELYWARHFRGEPGYDPRLTFEDYAPAYRLGIVVRMLRSDSWEESEDKLAAFWEQHPWSQLLSWEEARGPVRAAWTRVDRAFMRRH